MLKPSKEKEQRPRYAWHTGIGSKPRWDDCVMQERPQDDTPRQIGSVNVFLVEIPPPKLKEE